MAPLLTLPNELRLSAVCSQYPCRETQIRTLATLISTTGGSCRNIVLHGLEATGKSSTTRALLNMLAASDIDRDDDDEEEYSLEVQGDRLRFAMINSLECVSGRHFLEQTIGSVTKVLGWQGSVPRCENLSQFAVELANVIGHWRSKGHNDHRRRRFMLIFDGIDHQREGPATLLPALARLGEMIPNLTIIFILASPRPNVLHLSGVPYIHYSSYTKSELLKILALHDAKPQLPAGKQETKDVWLKFCSAIWDSLARHAGRDLSSFESLCIRLWPTFVRPILDGTHASSQFGGILIANKSLFQDDNHLLPKLVVDSSIRAQTSSTSRAKQHKNQEVGAQLPFFSRLLLVAAYFASYNSQRTDQLFFMKAAASTRRKKGGGTAKKRQGHAKSRKISRKLLGPQAFVLERMLAIFHAIRPDADNSKTRPGTANITGSADIQTAIATLTSLRFVVKMGNAINGDTLDGNTKWRVAVGWDVVRGIARSVGIEAEDYLVE